MMLEQVLRESFAQRLRAFGTEATSAFADAITDVHEQAGLPCWGHIADRFEQLCTRDEDRILVLQACRGVRDLSALLLFVDANRARPAVIASMTKDAQHLPFTVQCALASMPEAKVHLAEAVGLHPAAAEILAGDDALRAGEHSVYAAHANALRSHRTRSPRSPVTSPEVPEARTSGDLP